MPQALVVRRRRACVRKRSGRSAFEKVRLSMTTANGNRHGVHGHAHNARSRSVRNNETLIHLPVALIDYSRIALGHCSVGPSHCGARAARVRAAPTARWPHCTHTCADARFQRPDGGTGDAAAAAMGSRLASGGGSRRPRSMNRPWNRPHSPKPYAVWLQTPAPPSTPSVSVPQPRDGACGCYTVPSTTSSPIIIISHPESACGRHAVRSFGTSRRQRSALPPGPDAGAVARPPLPECAGEPQARTPHASCTP